MKTNLKSGNAIVRLLLAHGEKIGILAIIVCTGMIVWSAVGRERLSFEPSQLKSLASTTDTKLAGFTWNALPAEEKSHRRTTTAIGNGKNQERRVSKFPWQL